MIRRAQNLLRGSEAYIIRQNNSYFGYINDIQTYERHQILVKIVQADEFEILELDIDLNRSYGFFVEPGDAESIIGLRVVFGNDLIGPEYSPNNIPDDFEYVLYKYIPS